jgi:hypothetical protein
MSNDSSDLMFGITIMTAVMSNVVMNIAMLMTKIGALPSSLETTPAATFELSAVIPDPQCQPRFSNQGLVGSAVHTQMNCITMGMRFFGRLGHASVSVVRWIGGF